MGYLLVFVLGVGAGVLIAAWKSAQDEEFRDECRKRNEQYWHRQNLD